MGLLLKTVLQKTQRGCYRCKVSCKSCRRLFQVTDIELTNTETGERTSILTKLAKFQQTASFTEEMDLVAQTLYVEERFSISNEAYHELSMVNNSLPHSKSNP